MRRLLLLGLFVIGLTIAVPAQGHAGYCDTSCFAGSWCDTPCDLRAPDGWPSTCGEYGTCDPNWCPEEKVSDNYYSVTYGSVCSSGICRWAIEHEEVFQDCHGDYWVECEQTANYGCYSYDACYLPQGQCS
jgi:hypothetical protein